MNKTIVAIYDDIAVARQVVEDLVNADFARSSISLTTNDSNNRYSHYLDKDYVPRNDAVTAAQGAVFGGVVGTLTGVLVGLAAMTIPDIGLAIVIGPIAAGLTGALAGIIIGSIVGALVKSSVPEDEAPYYAEGIRRGGTLISIKTSDTLRAEDILNRYGSTNIHERINLWRQAGWKGFDTQEETVKTDNKPSPEMLTTVTTDTTTTRVTHTAHGVTPVSVEPLDPAEDEEAPIEYEYTARALPVIIAPPPAIDDTPLPAPVHDGVAKQEEVAVEHVEAAEQMMFIEPVLPVVPVEDLPGQYRYTVDDFQPIEPIRNHPKE